MSEKITHLTKEGIRILNNMENPHENNEKIYLQVTQVKQYEQQKKANSIRIR